MNSGVGVGAVEHLVPGLDVVDLLLLGITVAGLLRGQAAVSPLVHGWTAAVAGPCCGQIAAIFTVFFGRLLGDAVAHQPEADDADLGGRVPDCVQHGEALAKQAFEVAGA